MNVEPIRQLRRDVRWLKSYAGFLTLILATLLIIGARSEGEAERIPALKTERIDIVDAQGRTRLVIAGPQRMPGPKGPQDFTRGTRNIVPAGLLFYDEAENEIGGLALAPDKRGDLAALLFDYDKHEAGGFYRRSMPDGSGYATFFINDAAPEGMSAKEAISRDWSRIKLQNPDRNAEVLLTDTAGKTRIRLRVDNRDQAAIEVLDPAGKVVFRAPEQAVATK
jgi:hypothetical protein